MARPPARIQLTAEEESTLREWTRKGTGEQRLADRARIVLLSHEGMTVEMIAEHLHPAGANIEVAPAICRRAAERLVGCAAARQTAHLYGGNRTTRVAVT